MFSSSDVLGQRAPNLVEGVELDLQVRAQSGACLRPDPDGCTSDTYTLWSSSSATIKSANAYGMCGAYLDKPTKNLNCKTNDQGGWSPGSVAANLDDRFRCDSQNTHCVLCLSITWCATGAVQLEAVPDGGGGTEERIHRMEDHAERAIAVPAGSRRAKGCQHKTALYILKERDAVTETGGHRRKF